MATSNLTNRVKTPGVYTEEIAKLPPSIAQVETAIPAFIGYTEKAEDSRKQLLFMEPYRITSMLEYERYFGGALPETAIKVKIAKTDKGDEVTADIDKTNRSKFLMYYALQLFFANGGGPCWIVSVGDYTQGIGAANLNRGLAQTEKVDEVTLYVFPDAQAMGSAADYYGLYNAALEMCRKLKDRFTVTDVWQDPNVPADRWADNIALLRNNLGGTDIDLLKYGASYFPNLETTLDFYYGDEGAPAADNRVTVDYYGQETNLADLRGKDNALYFRARSAIGQIPNIMPPSPAIVGIYARVDDARGVWKAPANEVVLAVSDPEINLTDLDQAGLNVDVQFGKSVNVIRSFTGRGNLVWGARTLAGNDNEWRYIPVRRYFNMVEESTKNATLRFVFEPNVLNTWTRVRSMIENFLTNQWKAGALMGTNTEQAYYVHVGLNETMTEVDIWEGKMIVEIGLAVVRPAEFIILQFMHKMLSET